ncbi:hypothetical protein COV11_02950 [Candidatus Woesearchaeota archaeon CG10_big_fil_rev_8_21_14_0_10_30_7]|nr:MAG: hypothetical protein COV11_02950 [Candidatus Woesearchaeota archaeon CG10_big_fil_rev_8_21_14_0_10_30_7]
MGVWGTDQWMLEGSTNLDNIKVVLNAYRSIRERITYCSVPITSGHFYYSELEKKGVKSIDELVEEDQKIFIKYIMDNNSKEGIAFADEIAKESRRPVISPCAFEARTQRWREDDYMYLWFRLIEEKAKKLVMKPGWEYSNGASREFVRAIEMQFGFINPGNSLAKLPDDVDLNKEYDRIKKINLYAPGWQYLYLEDGVKLLSYAIHDLKQKGFEVPILEQSLCKLYHISLFGIKNLEQKKEKIPYKPEFDTEDSIISKEIKNLTKLKNKQLPLFKSKLEELKLKYN